MFNYTNWLHEHCLLPPGGRLWERHLGIGLDAVGFEVRKKGRLNPGREWRMCIFDSQSSSVLSLTEAACFSGRPLDGAKSCRRRLHFSSWLWALAIVCSEWCRGRRASASPVSCASGAWFGATSSLGGVTLAREISPEQSPGPAWLIMLIVAGQLQGNPLALVSSDQAGPSPEPLPLRFKGNDQWWINLRRDFMDTDVM